MAESTHSTLVLDAATGAEAASVRTDEQWRRRLVLFGVLCAVWTIPGLVGGLVLGTMAAGPDAESPVSLPRAIVWQVLAWLPWAVWTAAAIWLVRRVPFTRSTWPRAVALHLVVCVVAVSAQILLAVALDRAFWPGPIETTVSTHIRDAFLKMADFKVVTYMSVVAAGVGIDYFRRFREQQVAAERLRTEMVQAQLLALRSQLNPHFLFNALNTVISLMDRDVPAAQTMIARLGELLRLSLSADEAVVPLARELAHVHLYLEIERIRFGDRLVVEVDVPLDAGRAMVPNLVLQPLVENAIVHGVAPRPGRGVVRVEAFADRDELVLRVSDDGSGPSQNPVSSGHGIGVSNTRARLAALYGDRAALTLAVRDGGGCVAEVRLPFEESRAG